jgi:3-oxoacyl-[acyl-carrier protein] reductase
MNPLDFTGQNVLVVGGSSGIGNGIAQAFHGAGARVHVWGTRATAADYRLDEGCDLRGLGYSQVDVGDVDAVERVDVPFDALNVLVLSQGTVVYQRGEFERAGWDKVMAVNLDSLRACAVRFKSLLADSAGSLLIISSTSAYHATHGNPAYAASKAAAVALVRTLGQAWARERIRVNGIAPGLVDTKLTRITTGNEQRLARALSGIPAGRLGTPADMAGAALYLASPLASYVIGQTLIVDGGLTLS